MGVEELFEDDDRSNGGVIHRRFSYDHSGFLCVDRSDINGPLGSEMYALSFSHFSSLEAVYLRRDSEMLTFQTELKILTRLSDKERVRRIQLLIPNLGDPDDKLLRSQDKIN